MQLLTQGGPGTATYSLTYMTFRSAFKLRKYGYGCTSAVSLMLMCLASIAVINMLMSKKKENERWKETKKDLTRTGYKKLYY